MIRSFFSIAFILVVSGVLFISCGDRYEALDNPSPPSPPVQQNKPPVANAGPDIFIGDTTCRSLGHTFLVGSRSYDPDGNNLSYHWTKISGPADGMLSNNGDDTAIYVDIRAGLYAFELRVTNSKGLTARDTMTVDARNWSLRQYDLDVSFAGSYVFNDNRFVECVDTPCTYIDEILINATGTAAPFGRVHFFGNQSTDTAYASTPAIYSNMGVETEARYPFHQLFISGTCSISFKDIIQKGGGPFTGEITINDGSASNCVPGIFTGLAPFTISGNIDTLTRAINVNLKGKAFF